MPRADYPEELNITIEGKWKVTRKIGQGGISAIYTGYDIDHPDTKYAMKATWVSEEMGTLKDAEREAELMKGMHHPGILECFDGYKVTIEGRACYISRLEDMLGWKECVDLYQLLTKPGYKCTVEFVEGLWRELASAIMYMHSRGIVHRDISVNNVMLSLTGRAKIGDFASARPPTEDCDGRGIYSVMRHRETATYFTDLYASLEVRNGEPYSGKTDIWSLGVIIFQAFTGRLPGKSDRRRLEGAGVAPPLCDLLLRMFSVDQDSRPTAAEIVAYGALRRRPTLIYRHEGGMTVEKLNWLQELGVNVLLHACDTNELALAMAKMEAEAGLDDVDVLIDERVGDLGSLIRDLREAPKPFTKTIRIIAADDGKPARTIDQHRLHVEVYKRPVGEYIRNASLRFAAPATAEESSCCLLI